MKKRIVKLTGIIICSLILFLTLTLNVKSDNSDLSLESLEARACYEFNYNGVYIWDCCAPWEALCHSEMSEEVGEGIIEFPGTPTF